MAVVSFGCAEAPAPAGEAGISGQQAGSPATLPTGDVAADEAATADAATEDAPAEGGPPDAAQAASDGSRPTFERPDSLRGLYLNAWAAGSSTRMDALIDLARRTEVNAFVIDIKDATGFVSHRSDVPAVAEVGADQEIRIRDLPALLRRLEGEGIYPIARIVIVKDPLLAAARPELAIQDTAGGIWIDSKDIVWLNLYNEGVWDYHVDLAREVAEMGFPEIQWDYVRFPDAPASDLARALFPGDSIGPRAEAVRAFLGSSRDDLRESGLGVRVTADVFGVTTIFRRDVGIGQLWESFIDQVDAALPMVYPSHYWEGSFGFDVPNAHPYEVVYESVEYAMGRSEIVDSAGPVSGEIVPWLQDFTLGSPRYEGPEVRAQIQATYDAGASDWILWNPGSSYTEEALRPADGWEDEPLVRIGTRIVPVGERFEALQIVADSVERSDMQADRGPADAPPAPDTTTVRR
jgi:hypothetical protein